MREKRKHEKEKIWLDGKPTCSTESFQQQVQKLFIDILADVDLWREQYCLCV